jgi:plastocyanin
MERQELAARYLEGQMGRRVFLRRLVGLGVTLPAAVAYADLLRADPAAAATYDYYVYVQDYAYLGSPTRLASFGQTVEWGGFFSGGGHTHSATDPTAWINSGFKTGGSAYDRQMAFSGTFKYHCAETTHPLYPMNGKVKVPMSVSPASGPLGTAFTLGWSTISGLTDYSFDVQRRRPSDSGFVNWIKKTSTRGISYTPSARGTYRFRARTRNTATGVVTGWSPVLSISVT